jgi:hypothetical protein
MDTDSLGERIYKNVHPFVEMGSSDRSNSVMMEIQRQVMAVRTNANMSFFILALVNLVFATRPLT